MTGSWTMAVSVVNSVIGRRVRPWAVIVVTPISIKQNKTSKRSIANHFYGVYLYIIGTHESGYKQGNADKELPWTIIHGAKVLTVHKHQGSSSKQPHYSRAQSEEYALYGRRIHIAHEHLADENH